MLALALLRAIIIITAMKITELKPVPKNKIGRIIAKNVHLEPHEYETVLFLVLFGYNIEIVTPTNIPKSNNPDFIINGAVWESKAPLGSGKYTIQRHFHKAGHQSDRMILDLRRMKASMAELEPEVIKRFSFSKSIKHLILITKDGRLLDIKK